MDVDTYKLDTKNLRTGNLDVKSDIHLLLVPHKAALPIPWAGHRRLNRPPPHWATQ